MQAWCRSCRSEGYNFPVSAAKLDEVARRHGILLLLQFGSSVSGALRPDSDLDLAVLLERAPDSFREHGELVGDLQQCFPEREVDVTLINRSPRILGRTRIHVSRPTDEPSSWK